MGQDAIAVVDERLRVHGIDGLRVVDASIMPTVTSRQHQRADDHDRREGRRHDQGRRARGSRRRDERASQAVAARRHPGAGAGPDAEGDDRARDRAHPGAARAAGRGGRARHLFGGDAREIHRGRLLPHHPAENVRRLRVRSRHVLSRDAGDRARPSGRRLVPGARGLACVRGRVALERAGAGRAVRRRALHRAASRAAARHADAGRGRLSAERASGTIAPAFPTRRISSAAR